VTFDDEDDFVTVLDEVDFCNILSSTIGALWVVVMITDSPFCPPLTAELVEELEITPLDDVIDCEPAFFSSFLFCFFMTMLVRGLVVLAQKFN
jgi:hypothetical protein